MKKNLLLMLFVSCFGGTAVVNANPVDAVETTVNAPLPKTDILNAVEIGDFSYNLDTENMTAEVCKGIWEDEYLASVTVPSTVEYDGKTYTVTSLGNGAFSYREYLRFVTLPETLTNIEKRAFIKCWALESVNLPASVKSIGQWAFKNCECLLNIELPAELETLGVEAFYNCPSLRSVKCGEKLTEIPDGAFGYCYALSEINLPKNLTKIGNQAFYSCQCLPNMVLPETVEYIGEYAFGTCMAMTEISIPSKINSILAGTFINCTGLEKVVIPENVVKIYSKAFAFCENLDDLTISKNVEFIGANAFQGCSMSYLTFEDGDKVCVVDNQNLRDGRVSAFDGVAISELYIGREVQNLCNWSDEFMKKLTFGPNLSVWHNEYCGKQANVVESLIQDPTQMIPSFDEKIYEKATLKVPAGTIDLYKNTDGWKNFTKIEEAETPTGIAGVDAESNEVCGYYSVDGMRSDRPMKGLNIVKYSNGDVKKVYIK